MVIENGPLENVYIPGGDGLFLGRLLGSKLGAAVKDAAGLEAKEHERRKLTI